MTSKQREEAMKNFCAKLKKERERQGLQQNELGTMIGKARGYGWLMESGKQEPTVEFMEKLVDLFNKPLAFFFPDGVPELRRENEGIKEFNNRVPRDGRTSQKERIENVVQSRKNELKKIEESDVTKNARIRMNNRLEEAGQKANEGNTEGEGQLTDNKEKPLEDVHTEISENAEDEVALTTANENIVNTNVPMEELVKQAKAWVEEQKALPKKEVPPQALEIKEQPIIEENQEIIEKSLEIPKKVEIPEILERKTRKITIDVPIDGGRSIKITIEE